MNHKRRRPPASRAACLCGSKFDKAFSKGLRHYSQGKSYGFSSGSHLRLRVRAHEQE